MNLLPNFVDDPTRLPGALLTVTYDPALVVLSLLLAGFTSIVVLRLVGHLRTTADSRRQRRLILLAGVTLGGGIWSMHFTGMLAAALPVETAYDPLLTTVSLLIPIAICTLGLFWMRVPVISARRLIVSGGTAGLGIVVMHYLGMAAMRAPVAMSYRPDLFFASVAIGLLATIAAFWFARHFSDETVAEPTPLVAGGTAVLMAVAISGMHYTGMAAMSLEDRPGMTLGAAFVLDPHLMASAIAVMLLVVLGAALLALTVEDDTSGHIRLAMLPLLMAAVAAAAGGTTVAVLYDTAIRLERSELGEIARAQRELIEAVARFDARYSNNAVSGGASAATLSQVQDAHGRFSGFGGTGEFYLARAGNDTIDYVVPLRFIVGDEPTVTLTGSRDRPMQLALAGRTGTTIAHDYRGERVLAAYTPVPALGLGLVIKLDMQEIRAPFQGAALLAVLVTVGFIAIGFQVGRRISSPVISELDEKARLELELEFARAVQEGLLPAAAPQREGCVLAASTLPARFVSGDFYDFVELDDHRIGVIVGDVAGKGVSAALLMARLLSDARHAFARAPDTASVLGMVNEAVAANTRQGLFATACCLLIDLEAGQLEIASAGHLPLIRRDAGGRIDTVGQPSGPPLGVVEGTRYEAERLPLARGETIVAYTDGVIEPRNAAGEAFGQDRLCALIAACDRTPEKLIGDLHAAIESFMPGAAQHDDLTLLVLRAG